MIKKNSNNEKNKKIKIKKNFSNFFPKTIKIIKKRKEEAKNKFSVVKNSDKKSPVIKVVNITKTYGDFKALDNISFEMKKGEIIGLIGGNGAGKTTLSEIIAGIIKPESGRIEFGFNYKNDFKENIGMQFQQFEYPSGLSVKDIVAFARNLRKLSISNIEIKKILKTFDMEDFYRKKVNSLSGGQKQKLNILLSMIHNPDFLILDELSTGLDVIARESIIDFTKKLIQKNKSSCILISHHMVEIETLCSRVIVLSKGKIVANESVDQIKKKYKTMTDYMRYMIRSNHIKEDYNKGAV